MIALDRDMILRSLDREHGFSQRQSLLRRLWQLDEAEAREEDRDANSDCGGEAKP